MVALTHDPRRNSVLDAGCTPQIEVADSSSNVGTASTSEVPSATPPAKHGLGSLRRIPFDCSITQHQEAAVQLQEEIATLRRELSKRYLQNHVSRSDDAYMSSNSSPSRSGTRSHMSSAEAEISARVDRC